MTESYFAIDQKNGFCADRWLAAQHRKSKAGTHTQSVARYARRELPQLRASSYPAKQRY